MTTPPVVVRALEDRAAGRHWKARDRLFGAVACQPPDQRVLDLLGEVLFEMGDLPQAGRYWYLTERQGPDVDQALAALHERFGDGPNLVHALPVKSPVSAYPPAVRARLETLTAHLPAPSAWDPASGTGHIVFDSRLARVGCTAAFGVLVVCLAVGLITIVSWLV